MKYRIFTNSIENDFDRCESNSLIHLKKICVEQHLKHGIAHRIRVVEIEEGNTFIFSIKCEKNYETV